MDKLLARIERMDDLMDRLADEVVLPILEQHYASSGIKHGGIYGGRHAGLLKPAVTKRGAFGNVIYKSAHSLTVGVSYQAIPYARWVIEGRGPVRPVRAKMLHWIDPDTGKDVFRKCVGPAPPHPLYYVTPAELHKIELALNAMIIGGK